MECYAPQATSSTGFAAPNFTTGLNSVHKESLSRPPWPSCPCLFDPQDSTSPAPVTTNVCLRPVAAVLSCFPCRLCTIVVPIVRDQRKPLKLSQLAPMLLCIYRMTYPLQRLSFPNQAARNHCGPTSKCGPGSTLLLSGKKNCQ